MKDTANQLASRRVECFANFDTVVEQAQVPSHCSHAATLGTARCCWYGVCDVQCWAGATDDHIRPVGRASEQGESYTTGTRVSGWHCTSH